MAARRAKIMIAGSLAFVALVYVAGCEDRAGARPAATAPGGAASSRPPLTTRDGETFADDVAELHRMMPMRTRASAVALRFVNESTKKPLTLLYADDAAPQWNERAAKWMVLAQAVVDREIVSTVAVLVPELVAERFDGKHGRRDCILGAAVGTSAWSPDDSATAWSSNAGGYCDIEMRDAQRVGHLEAALHGKLVANSGRDYFVIDAGYLYIAR